MCSSPVFSQTNILKEFSIQGLYCGITKSSDQGLAVVYENAHTVYLVKMDSLLNISWTKQLNISVSTDPMNIITTTDGGYIISSLFFNGGSFRTLLIKTDSQGNTLWSYYYERNWPVVTVGMVATATNGAVVLNNDFSIFEIDSLGNVLTSVKCSANSDVSASSLLAFNGAYYVYGVSRTSGIADFYLTKLNASLQVVWTQEYDGNYPSVYATCMQKGLNNTLVLAGYIPYTSDTAFIFSVDLNGNFLWGKLYFNPGTSVFSIHTDTSGYYVLGGMLTDPTYQNSKDVLIRIHDDGTFMDAVCTGNSYASGFGAENVEEIVDGYNNDFYVLTSNFVLKSTYETNPLCYYSNLTYSVSTFSASTVPVSFSMNSVPLVPTTVTVNSINAGLPEVNCNNSGISESYNSSSIEVNYFSEEQILEVSSSNTMHQGSVGIFDFLGKEVVQYPIREESEKKFSLSNLPAGIYFLLVQADANYHTLKFLKR